MVHIFHNHLNKLKKGCSPCMLEAKKMEQKISNRRISEIKLEEVKTIVSSMFKKVRKYDVNFSGSMQAIFLHSSHFSQRT